MREDRVGEILKGQVRDLCFKPNFICFQYTRVCSYQEFIEVHDRQEATHTCVYFEILFIS